MGCFHNHYNSSHSITDYYFYGLNAVYVAIYAYGYTSGGFGSKMLLLCISYEFTAEDMQNNVTPNGLLYSVKGFKQDFNLSDFIYSVPGLVKELYKQVPKPSIQYSYYITYKGEIIEINKNESDADVTGNNCIYEFNLFEDVRIDNYSNLLKDFESKRNSIFTVDPLTGYIKQVNPNPNLHREYARLQQRLINFEVYYPKQSFNEIDHGLFEGIHLEANDGFDVR